MPELPEVQTTVSGLARYVLSQHIDDVVFYRDNLRYPLENCWINNIRGQTINHISRRAKMIIMQLESGFLLWHLGMTGSMRVSTWDETKRPHDHVELQLSNHTKLRFHDPRRFGYLKYFNDETALQASIAHYGVEPLSKAFNAKYLWQQTRNKSQPVKNTIMEQPLVVGVGNIYACEALFMAGISPKRASNRISKVRYERLVTAIKEVLLAAIAQGGTTLKDFENADAKPGYFQQKLLVYGRAGQPCFTCGQRIKSIKLGGRNSFYCPTCQK